MGNKTKKNDKFINLYFKILTFFTLGSFLGCVYETIYAFLKKGYWVSRQGLIYGPFSQVYGFAIILVVLLLERYYKDNKKLTIYLLGGIICGIAEYICSLSQELIFHTYSWDYSRFYFDINGRTSIFHMLFWGLLVYLFMQYVYPLIIKLISKISYAAKVWIAITVTIFFVLNMIISSFACLRQYERKEKIPATNKVQVFLDKYYPDEFLEMIYPNKRYKK